MEYRGSDAPGPGGYEIKYGAEGPQYTMGSKVVETRFEHSPGPGQYELKKSQEGPQWVMGTSKRSEMRGSEAPGPG